MLLVECKLIECACKKWTYQILHIGTQTDSSEKQKWFDPILESLQYIWASNRIQNNPTFADIHFLCGAENHFSLGFHLINRQIDCLPKIRNFFT